MYKDELFYNINPAVKIIEPKNFNRSFGKYLYIIRVISYLRYHFRKEKPDIIFSIGHIALTLFASFGLKTKVVISFRSNPKRVRFPKNKFLNFIYVLTHKLLKRRVNGIIAQTKYAEEIFKKRYNCQVITIPNFLRELNYYEHEKQNQIITVGHCSWEKGHHFLLKAFSQLKAPSWKLMIVGDGPKRKELEELAIRLNINQM